MGTVRDVYVLCFMIQGLPKRTNNNMGHWRTRHAEAKLWKRRVAEAVCRSRAGWAAEPLPYVNLCLTRHSSIEPDYDGLVSSFKHVIDGLIDCGVLANDKTSNFVGGRPEYKWCKARPKKGFIEIELVEFRLNV